MLWVFGLEGGLAGRPLLLLLGSSEMRASVPSWPIRAPSIDIPSLLLLGALWSWWTERRVLEISELPVKQFSL